MRRRFIRCFTWSCLLVVSPLLLIHAADQDQGLDDQGFITTWLVLAPIPLDEGQDGAEALGKEQVKDEAHLAPKPGDMTRAAGKSLVWKECRAKNHVLDLNDSLGQVTENSVGYAVAYLISDVDQRDLTLRVGSDDQVKVFLNGIQIHDYDEARALEEDEDSIPNLTLKRGMNVLVLKVINEGEDWESCARFEDKDGNPLKGLKVVIPEPR